jgi:hypothetical protein
MIDLIKSLNNLLMKLKNSEKNSQNFILIEKVENAIFNLEKIFEINNVI